jgi:hypothetical protein
VTCDHTERRTVYVEWEDDWTGEQCSEWQTEVICLQDDIDLHRFKCRRCGEIGYYSGAARRFYEGGVKSPGIKGLE